jgi:CheY-like chemotaxis protein
MPTFREASTGMMPYSRGENRNSSEPCTTSGALQGRVLVVDDGPENRQLLRIILGKVGLDVESANNGLDACCMAEKSLAAGRPFNLIVMDMQMPELDGYEATRRLRREGWDRPIVALTAYAMAGDREKCLAAGCDEYLAKPVDRRRLLQTVGDCLGQPLADHKGPPPPNSTPRSLLDDPRISRSERARITHRFLSTLTGRVSRIRQALREEDRDLLIAEVHSLAGTAGLMGFSKLSERARDLERQARDDGPFPDLCTAVAPLLQLACDAEQDHGCD